MKLSAIPLWKYLLLFQEISESIFRLYLTSDFCFSKSNPLGRDRTCTLIEFTSTVHIQCMLNFMSCYVGGFINR